MNTLNKYKWILVLLTIILLGLFFIKSVEATGQETCPNSEPWVKVDNLDGFSYTFTPPSGYHVTDNCYKHSTYVHYGTGDTVTADYHWECNPWWNCRLKHYELSHASFKLERNEVVDVCNNLDGVQEETPEGYLNNEGYCYVPEQECEVDCEEPTPTPTPVVFTGVSDGRSDGKGEYHAPVCSGIFPDKPLLQGFKLGSKGQVTFSWWGVQADKYSLRYGYTLDQLVYGIPYIPNTSTAVEINGLESGRNVWAVVTAYKGECATDSSPLDPIVR